MIEDSILRKAVLAALQADDRLSSQAIEVEVSRGRITLSGSVQSFRRKLAAHSAAAAVAGSASVENQVEVVAPEMPSDHDVAEDVRALIEQHPELIVHAIVVEVRAGRVTLSGTVKAESERVLAGDVALQAPGAREVANQLIIEPGARHEAVVVASELQELLASEERLAGCDLRIAISGDIVVLSGTAGTRAQLEGAEALIRTAWTGQVRQEVALE